MSEITPGDISVHLGQSLKRRRLSQRLRLVDVAQRAGLSVPTIRAIEQGEASVSFGNYAFVAVLLGAGDLFEPIISDALMDASGLKRSRVRVSKPRMNS
jgi:transcriptional regulator with XRE-family HTH domain